MPRYKFTGLAPESFPLLAADVTPVLGSALLEPGDVIDVPGLVAHPRLELTDEPASPARERARHETDRYDADLEAPELAELEVPAAPDEED